MLTGTDYGIVGVAVVALIYVVLFWPAAPVPASRPRRFYRSWYNRRVYRDRHRVENPVAPDAGRQLNAVMAAPFERRRLLNSGEYQAFRVIEADIAASRQGYRVFAQTSLGEVLHSPDEDAFHSINSKRVDILIVDRGGWPVVAVEYQGRGHYLGGASAAVRDAVKQEALRKAGVRYVEVCSNDSAAEIRSRVREQLGWKTGELAAQAAPPKSR